MDRRSFFTVAGVGAAALAGAGGAELAAQSRRGAASARGNARQPLRVKLGCQSGPSTDEHFAYFERYGVTHISAGPRIADNRTSPTVDELSRLKEMAQKHNLVLELLTPPILSSSHTDREPNYAITRAESPQRDRDIEAFQNTLRYCQQVGIPAVKYNMSILGVVRTPRTPGRGDSFYSTWRLNEAPFRNVTAQGGTAGDSDEATRTLANKGLTKAGRVNADAFWERIEYFLDRVVPVANETKVRIACHPHDPGMPPSGYQGVDRVLGTPDGLKKFVAYRESPYHGLNFCQGTVTEMLQNPNEEIHDIIRHFGSRRKIFNVHFRNIAGKRDSFTETFPDNGDIDMVRALMTYREVGYDGMLMPDHVPQAANDPNGLQSFAFAYGYIRGLMQSMERMA